MAILHAIRESGRRVGALLHRFMWSGDEFSDDDQPTVSTGFRRLDQELPGGGWPVGTLTELLLPRAGIGELRLLAPVLRRLADEERWMVLIAPPALDDCKHLPYGPALEKLGLRLDRLLVIDADQATDRLWAVEQSLRCPSFGALLVWLPEARPDQLRRLQLAAQGSDGLCFVMRPQTAQIESSPAPLRLACKAVRGSHVGELTGTSPHRLEIDILKRRGPWLDAPLRLELPPPLVSLGQADPIESPLPALQPVRYDHAVDRPRLYAAAA
ncbi:translesion DNA synthesis-associated protein ImuA [Derxia lacustris]|uniref:translesion DNA synthesis-associated protein ImuA n=1 Tax=Derxia lacustris TaxID=764842 RepID=UPI00111C4953|nr:translesion DNA synthesis-associated protein ImuA [Derxia lacustris]